MSMKLPENTIIASGPVIIEDGKVLLNREKKEYGETLWFFPGGKMEETDENFEATCIREVKEEMGLEIEILRPLKPMIMARPDKPNEMAIIIHFLARRLGEIRPAENIVEWNWFPIQELPKNCAPNVNIVIQDYLRELKRD